MDFVQVPDTYYDNVLDRVRERAGVEGDALDHGRSAYAKATADKVGPWTIDEDHGRPIVCRFSQVSTKD